MLKDEQLEILYSTHPSFEEQVSYQSWDPMIAFNSNVSNQFKNSSNFSKENITKFV